MRIAYRLYAAIVPAVLGVLLVAGLSYWGQYGRSTPVSVLLVAGIAALVSLIIVWRNTRYVAQRIEALATPEASPGVTLPAVDEIDAIHHRLESLGVEAANAAENARKRASEFEALVAEVAYGSRKRVEEARMPVHILLTAQFGELNENQEEMLGAADSALTALDDELERLRTIITSAVSNR